jgi:hypothetical protein
MLLVVGSLVRLLLAMPLGDDEGTGRCFLVLDIAVLLRCCFDEVVMRCPGGFPLDI